MSDASVLKDDSRLSRMDQTLFRVESFLTLTGGLVILALMFLAVTQIVGRKLFNAPIPGFIDWVEQAMAVFAFLGISYCQRVGGHIRMDIVLGMLRGRILWINELISVLVMLLLTVVLTVGSWRHFLRAYQNGDSSIDIALPTWPAKLMVPVALSILTLRLVLQLWAYGRALKTGTEQPVAVPLIETAAEQAAREAETVSSTND